MAQTKTKLAEQIDTVPAPVQTSQPDLAAKMRQIGGLDANAPTPRRIAVHRFHNAEHQCNSWVIYPEPGTTLADVLRPSYWRHVAISLRPFDLIHVRFDGGTEWAMLVVRVIEKFTAVVDVLLHKQWTVKTPAATAAHYEPVDGYKVEFRGRNGWCVLRLEDNVFLREGEGGEAEAHAWLQMYLRKIG